MIGLKKLYSEKLSTETTFRWFDDISNDNVKRIIPFLNPMLGAVVNDLESRVFKRTIGQRPHVHTRRINNDLIQLYVYNRRH